jgi:N-methylhydantoinase B
MTDHHDDIADGDAYLHNDPYLGNTHPADHVVLVPVFHDGEHLFTTVAKAHQADTGNHEPTAYMPFAKDIYAEGGLIFPCVRVQRDRRHVEDVIRTCRRRIRVPDQWYGDFLATLGAARVGEARLEELCARYGTETIRAFVREWFDYSERKMAHAIAGMPAGTVAGTGTHDPLGDVLPDGIPLTVKVTVDPEAQHIEIDLTDNIDCVPAGVNESEACTVSNALTGVFNSLPPGIPANSGAFRRITLKLRENCIVGIPQFPASCSVATTNVGDRLVVTTQKAIADAWPGYGVAEGPTGLGPGFSVVSGVDRRRGGEPYVNQKFLGSQGGPAMPEVDGWVTYGLAVAGGLMLRDSIEIDELKYPIWVRELRIRRDSEGAGRRRGAPGTTIRFGPRWDPMTAAYITDCVLNPPRGTNGGGDAAPNLPFLDTPDVREKPVPPVALIEVGPDEVLGAHHTGGGGYGDPLEREPERVRADVLAGFVSFTRARDVYGVVFVEDVLAERLAVDRAATAARRAELARSQRRAGSAVHSAPNPIFGQHGKLSGFRARRKIEPLSAKGEQE